MLQHTVSRSLTRLSVPTSIAQCAVCTCRCGSAFRPNGVPTDQRRHAARKAPSTSHKARRLERTAALSPAEARKRKIGLESDKSQHYRTIQKLNASDLMSITPEVGVDFLNEFANLAKQTKGKNVVDLKNFKELVVEFGMQDRDLWWLSFMLLRWVEEDRILGKKLLFTLSATGNEEATIRILNHALLGNKAQPGLLRSSEILYARGHLREMARRGENYRVMVLEGKIAYELGDDDYAVQMWTQAMDAAVAVSEEEAVLRDQGKSSELKAMRSRHERDLSELSSPWIELTLIHYERYGRYWQRNEITSALSERDKARKACDIGCRQDDPTSHYHAAEFFKEFNPDGSTKHTSAWLYHMTKAAATSHVKAAHSLAEFYASSGWKYIEDEPPDHIKPTPFDSYPAPPNATATQGSKPSWRSLLGLEAFTKDPKDDIFHTAAFPSTPTDRWKLAFRWLEPALNYMYAPSYLLACKMLLEKNLWGQAHAPKSALDLTHDRYKFASKENYDNGKPIERPPDDVKPDEPNPGHNPTTAHIWLKDLFYAFEAHKLRLRLLHQAQTLIRKRRLSGFDAEDVADEENLPKDMPMHIKKWLRYPDVREMYEGEIESLEREAKEICERQGWDMYDEEGGLMFKHGLAAGKGATGTVAAMSSG